MYRSAIVGFVVLAVIHVLALMRIVLPLSHIVIILVAVLGVVMAFPLHFRAKELAANYAAHWGEHAVVRHCWYVIQSFPRPFRLLAYAYGAYSILGGAMLVYGHADEEYVILRGDDAPITIALITLILMAWFAYMGLVAGDADDARTLGERLIERANTLLRRKR